MAAMPDSEIVMLLKEDHESPERSRKAGTARKPARSAPNPLRVVPDGERAPRRSSVPPGRWLEIGDRGRTWIRDEPGPEGAPTLLMLHGLGATGGLNWAGSHHVLRDRFRVVTIDHRGHGRGIRTRRFSLEDCADDAAAVIETLGLDRPIVVGYSMGGPIASLLWKRHPGAVGGLVFCATSRNFRGSPAEKLAFGALGVVGLSPVVLPERLVRTWGSLLCALPLPASGLVQDVRWAIDEMAGHDPRAVIQAAAAIGEFNSTPWIGQIDVPASVIVMTGDQIVPPIRQFRLARSIRHASVHCVDAGHLCVGGGAAKDRFLTTLRQACLEVAEQVAEQAGVGQRRFDQAPLGGVSGDLG